MMIFENNDENYEGDDDKNDNDSGANDNDNYYIIPIILVPQEAAAREGILLYKLCMVMVNLVLQYL